MNHDLFYIRCQTQCVYLHILVKYSWKKILIWLKNIYIVLFLTPILIPKKWLYLYYSSGSTEANQVMLMTCSKYIETTYTKVIEEKKILKNRNPYSNTSNCTSVRHSSRYSLKVTSTSFLNSLIDSGILPLFKEIKKKRYVLFSNGCNEQN